MFDALGIPKKDQHFTGVNWERDVGVGLLASIETGDGHSPAGAYTVIDVDEEYALMRARGLHVKSQALVQQSGHAYDMLTTLNAQVETSYKNPNAKEAPKKTTKK